MKNKVIIILTAIILIVRLNIPCYAVSNEQSSAIQSLLDEACRISNTPGMSVSVRFGEDLRYFSSGYADREKSLIMNKDTLLELASLSKAYTAFGILLLEEQGFLLMDDPVQKYLPWFTLRYDGKPVDMDRVTLNHFLHHTSGLTNSKHISMLPMGDGPDMLQKTVEAFIDAELAFIVGERTEYGTMNYDVLGLVIAEVSGQGYEGFMSSRVLAPLGLHETFMYENKAYSTGRLAKGYATSFMRTFPVESPKHEGNKPAGYIISCSTDMARWADIQLGLADNIPEDYRAAIKKSHRADKSVPAVNGLYYAGGWFVDAEGKNIGHSGDNPNFTTFIKIRPEKQSVVTLLTNSRYTNTQVITESIESILDGDLNQKYSIGMFQLFDRIGVAITIVGILFAFLFLLLGLRRWKNRNKNPMLKKRIILISVWIIITLVIALIGIFLPALTGADWKSMLDSAYMYSLLTGFTALTLTGGAVTWFVFARRK